MTPREKFAAALDRKPISGRVPTFELVFYLTMEALGKVHPSQRHYGQWDQMEEKERQLHREDMARVFVDTADKYEHSAIMLHPNPWKLEEIERLIDLVRERSEGKYFLILDGDATFAIPDGEHMVEWVERMADDPEGLKREAAGYVDRALERGEALAKHDGLDGFSLCADYCLNTGPFLSPGMFSEFVTPYLARLIEGYRSMGFYTIKHTDGNIMPILDQLVQANPHALHSLDPQAGVDIAEVKRLYGDRLCLIGNVNCALLDSGTNQECAENVRYALRHGMPGYGYIFSTSNCVYTGMSLKRYEDVLAVWRAEGNYGS